MAEDAKLYTVCGDSRVKNRSGSRCLGKPEDGSKQGFWKAESGSFTIEAVIWIPMFFALMIFAVNISMVFLQESLILRVVQTVSREHSLGLYRNDAEAEQDLTKRLSKLGASVDVDVTKSFKMATATVKVAASDLMPMQLFRDAFSSVEIDVTSNHLVEF